MVRATLLALIGGALLIALAPMPARAWDPEGDREVALLAYERLTPTARGQVDALLSARTAVDGCTVRALDDALGFTECLRGRKQDYMRGVVYDALPLCGPAPPSRCADGRCASSVLRRFIAELKDPTVPAAERVRALMAVTYLTAEIHQPLHAADNGDRGGDRLLVTLPGALKARTSLYTIWNDDLVASAIGDAQTGLPYVRSLADAHGDEWSRGDVADWLLDSHDVALHVAYGKLPNPPACNKLPDRFEGLGPDYFAVAAPAVRAQLAKAGVRLAAVLNSVFS